jgi:hypothetical protein
MHNLKFLIVTTIVVIACALGAASCVAYLADGEGEVKK